MEFENEKKIENVAVALIQDYLFKKGYATTLLSLKQEMPSDEKNAYKHTHIVSELRLEKAIKENKASAIQFDTLLEIFVRHRLRKISHLYLSRGNIQTSEKQQSDAANLNSLQVSGSCINISNRDSSQEKANLNKKFCNKYLIKDYISEPDLLDTQLKHFIEPSFLTSGCGCMSVHSYIKQCPSKPNVICRERRRLRSVSGPEVFSNTFAVTSRKENLQEKCTVVVPSLEEIEKDVSLLKVNGNFNFTVMNSENSKLTAGLLSSFLSEERPITVDEACAFRLLLFGNTVSTFGEEWTQQGFKFRSQLSYGIMQKRAGPCGVLAAVQAYVIYELLFGYSRTVLDSGLLRPNIGEKKEALARALTSILWQAGDNKQAVVAKKGDKIILDNSVTANILREDGMLEYLHLKYFRSKDSLLEYLYNIISELMTHKSGSCVLFLYSLILTHGIERIKEEMDYPESHLIGDDGYCSQEVVNLILVGKAVPNLFDGDLELNSGGEERSIHRGIPKQSKIGLLSLYEYQKTCMVGNFYKNPIYPIWVLLGDSHFTVLFATSRDIFNKTSPTDSFLLFYHDGLYKKNEETSFIIKPFGKSEAAEEDNTLPVVIRCIYTRWPKAQVELEEDKPF